MSATAVATATHCAHCQAELQGPYCHHCGEKRLDHHDYSLAHFLEHAVDTATHFDVKVVKGAWSLLWQPGRMTADVLRGCRVPWPKPLQLFLVVNVLFVFAAHQLGMQIFNTPYRYHAHNWYGGWARAQLESLAARRQQALPALTEQFDHLAEVLSKTLVFAFIPLLALGLTVLLWRRRRYYLEHLVAATHYQTLLLLLQMLVIGPLLLVGQVIRLLGHSVDQGRADLSIGLVMLLCLTGWGFGLLQRTYGGRRGPNVLRAAALSVFFAFLLLYVYRPFLFAITYLLL